MHGDEHTIVAVATNDIMITSKHLADIMRFKSDLSGHWDLNDLGEINWYLRFEVNTTGLHVPYRSINERT